MEEKMDLSADQLADADLTPDQRCVWEGVREQLAAAQAKNRDLSEKLQRYEQDGIVEGPPSILNHNDFNREVSRMLAFDERYGGITSILYFDFEGLADVSARLGPETGNLVLQKIMSVFASDVRRSDIVGKLASDEFGILLMRCENADAWRKGERLTSSLEAALAEIEDKNPGVEVSYGAYTFQDSDDVSVGLKEAEQSLLHPKK